jgi:hypothetical protein
MIAAVLTSVALPVMWGAYSDLSRNMTVSSVESEIIDLLHCMEEVVNGGVGSAVEIEMDLRSWGSCTLDHVVIGGQLNGSGPDRYLVRYILDGSTKGFLSLDPPLAMTLSSGEGPLELSEGSHDIRIVHGMAGHEHVAFIEKVN